MHQDVTYFQVSPWTIAVISGVLVCTLAVWGWIAVRLVRRRPLLAYEPRRPVPWHGVDLLLVLLIAVAVTIVVGQAVIGRFGPTPMGGPDHKTMLLRPVDLAEGMAVQVMVLLLAVAVLMYSTGATLQDMGLSGRNWVRDIFRGLVGFFAIVAPVLIVQNILIKWVVEYKHPLIDSLDNRHTTQMLIWSTLSAVLIAPVVEEFFFRGLLQGWFESLESKSQSVRQEAMPEMAQPSSETPSPESPTSGVALQSGRADITDGPSVWPILLSSLIFALMHLGQGAAPIPLFLLALVLGYLYQRTHRLLPSVVVHMLLNALTMAQLWLDIKR